MMTSTISVQLPDHDSVKGSLADRYTLSGPASGVKASPLGGTSYTQANPVAEHYECRPCQATLSGDNVTPFLADLFTRAHASCPAEEVTD